MMMIRTSKSLSHHCTILFNLVFPIEFRPKCNIQGRHFTNKDSRNNLLNRFGVYDVVLPACVSKERQVPAHIVKPSYITSTVLHEPDTTHNEPEIKSEAQLFKMRRSCKLARYILNSASAFAKVGCTTDEIDAYVHDLTIAHGAYPSPLKYKGFPKSVCTSVNNVACHGIPDDRRLQDGDLVNIDVTVFLDGYHGDCSETYQIGAVDMPGQLLVKAAKECFDQAISICSPGRKFSMIGEKVEQVAKETGFTVVPCFTGHGIGSYFHGPPDIYHCKNEYPGTMQPGMVFTIEPVLAQGSEEIVILDDGWTAVTFDNGRTAQFEHTILITEAGVEILT